MEAATAVSTESGRQYQHETGMQGEQDFGLFLQDVAARVIQHHYLQWKGRRTAKMDDLSADLGGVGAEGGKGLSGAGQGKAFVLRRSKSLEVSTTEVCFDTESDMESERDEEMRGEVSTSLGRSAESPRRRLTSSSEAEAVVKSPDRVPRKRTPKELPHRLKALRERDRNVLSRSQARNEETAGKPGFLLDNTHDLLKSTDKLQDILQFLKRADTSIDVEQSKSKPVFRTASPNADTTSPPDTSARATGTVSPSILRISANLERVGESLVGLSSQRPSEGKAGNGRVLEGLPAGNGGEDLGTVEQTEAIQNVCSGVHNKVKGLHSRIQMQKEAMADLENQVDEGKKREKKLEADFLERITQALDKQSKEHETSLKRHLSFIDRILKDKDLLSKKCEKLAVELKSLEEMYNKKIDRLQTQWAIELKKQKEVWQSAEKARREAWLSEKTREIKELTIKGLEPEIQRLIQKSKADLEDLESKHALDMRKKLDECKDYYDSYIHSLRDQWRREKDDLIEHERTNASSRLREQGDRYDSQMESLRMRLVSDFDSKLSSLETSKREENSRSENTLMRLRQEHATEVSKMNQEFEEKAKQLDRANDLEKERMREKFETEREGWRQMIVKKIKEEYGEKEKEMRSKVQHERNAELEMIVTKLEHETQMTREKLHEEFEIRTKEMKRDHAEEVRELKESNHKFSEKYREAAQLSQSSKKEITSIQSLNKASARELEVKAETISFLEKQLGATRKESLEKEKEIKAMYEDKVCILTEKVSSFGQRAEKSEIKLEEAANEISRLKAKNKSDMLEVEARVKEAITKRENIIAHLQNQLVSLQQNLEQTEGLLDH
ncbi:centrosomal protein [Chloropicon primus]|nr:centrosomal protein [Chloropicon primus]